MTQAFKFRRANEIVGTFVILVVLILLAGIFFAGHAQRWFEPVHKFKLTFPPEGSFGLKTGAEVVILGTVVGNLEEIKVSEDGTMTGQLIIKGDFIRFVRTDSRAVVKKKFVVAGDSYIEITKGEKEKLPPGMTLSAVKDTEITEMAQDVIGKIREATLPAIEQARRALEEYTKLAADLRDPEGNLQRLLGHLTGIARSLEEGTGPAGKILTDPAMADELEKILGDLRQASSKLPPMAETMAGEIGDLPGMVLQTRDTLRETQRLIEAIQKHWLLRGYVDRVEPSKLIPPSAISVGKQKEPSPPARDEERK